MAAGTTGPGPLAGVRVIEMGSFIAGPYGAQLLADLGADVIKIEAPGSGDPMRVWGVQTAASGASLWWPVIGRNKRSITLDLRRPEGQALARRLLLGADVLIENFRPGTLEGWNLDPAAIRRERPELIVARVSGYGQTGPYRERAGFAAVAEAMAGLRYLTGYPDRPPTRVGLSIGDTLAGMFSVIGVISALYARDGGRSGRPAGGGQTVDIAITDSVLAVLESVISEFSATGHIRERTGTALPGIAPSNLYPTQDGSWVVIGANGDGLFRRLAKVMGRPELADDERYATHRARGRNQREVDDLVAGWTRTLPRDAILALLDEAAIPAGPVSTAADVVANPHFRARGSVVEVDAGELGPLAMQGVMPRLSDTPGEIRWTGPALGAHNAEVYGGLLGLDAEEISRLKAEGII
jgi:formyl-CoA transferase/succinyl-CoA--D-citramalate CoA-transferase